MITKASLVQPVINKPVSAVKTSQSVSFGSDKSPEVQSKSSVMKKGAILAIAALALAIPIALLKIPAGKLKPLNTLQAKLKTFIQQTVKPMLDKVMSRTVSPDAGLNVLR